MLWAGTTVSLTSHLLSLPRKKVILGNLVALLTSGPNSNHTGKLGTVALAVILAVELKAEGLLCDVAIEGFLMGCSQHGL